MCDKASLRGILSYLSIYYAVVLKRLRYLIQKWTIFQTERTTEKVKS